MSDIVRLRTRTEIDEQAAIWAWRMDSETVSAADRKAFASWLRRDPRHRHASAELAKVWIALDGLAEAKHEEKMATFAAVGPAARNRRMGWAAAAAVVLTVAVAVPAWIPKGSELQTLATAVGQQRKVILADGSIVALNTNTIVETNLRRGSREIYLRKGEAHFQVAHDRSRPFLVHAGDAVVRAVGTQFEVRVRGDHHVDVVVNEGRVEVQSTVPDRANGGGSGSPIRAAAHTVVHALSAGQQLSPTSNDYTVIPVSTQQLSSALAWRDGAVVFEGTRLADAINEIERYTDARIVISDPQVAALRVGGRFRTGDVQEFFDALQAALPVSIRRTADGVVYLDPRH